jgi:hypothetical protein
MFQEFRKRKTELMENGNFCFLLLQQTENKIDEFPFVRYKRKRKTEVCSPWSTIDTRKSTIAISTNVPIYAYTYVCM